MENTVKCQKERTGDREYSEMSKKRTGGGEITVKCQKERKGEGEYSDM